MKYRCTNITWDTDGKNVNLMSEMVVTVKEDEATFDPEEQLAEYLSQATGWLVESFDFVRIK